MYKELDGTAIMDFLYGQKPSKEFRQYETIVRTINRIKTLVEDDNLLKNIIEFAKGRFCKSNRKPLTLEDAKNENRTQLIYYKIDENTKSGFGERWSTSRWEGDYCDPYFAGYDKVSFNEIIEEYVDKYPNKVKWKIEEKLMKEEKY